MSKQAVIMLHGVGSSGENLQGLVNYWTESLPNTLVIAPNAPFPFDQGPGYQWFSVTGISDETRPLRITQARKSFDLSIQAVLEEHQLDPQHDQIILAGFSQGSIMALDLLVSSRLPIAGVVAFSGRLSSPEPYSKSQEQAVLLIHGQKDPVIACSESQIAAQRLSDLGYKVETQYEPDTLHSISNEGAAKAAKFIAQRFS
ncbi:MULTISPECIES: alpha/beta hydrolase [unclassified Agarivorans]|uniref:alpha/beta hydrolase n=1 Tax=unclassified Agarivorans TaxID=2636026 RepID=UPI003D7E61DF